MYAKTRKTQLGFLPLLAFGQQALSTAAAHVQGKAQTKVLNAQTKLETVRTRAAEIAGKNRLMLYGVGGVLALGVLVAVLRR